MNANDPAQDRGGAQGLRPPSQGRSHPVIGSTATCCPLGELKRLMQEDTIAVVSMMNARQKQRFKEGTELDIAYSGPRSRPLPLQRLPAACGRWAGAPRHPGAHPERPRADAAAGARADLRGAARHGPLHRHHRLTPGNRPALAAMLEGFINSTRTNEHVDHHRGPDRVPSTATRSRSSTSARSTSDTHSFAGALRAALRQDPDVLLVGEMRDNYEDDRNRPSSPPRPGTWSSRPSTPWTPAENDQPHHLGLPAVPHHQKQIRIQLSQVLVGDLLAAPGAARRRHGARPRRRGAGSPPTSRATRWTSRSRCRGTASS